MKNFGSDTHRTGEPFIEKKTRRREKTLRSGKDAPAGRRSRTTKNGFDQRNPARMAPTHPENLQDVEGGVGNMKRRNGEPRERNDKNSQIIGTNNATNPI